MLENRDNFLSKQTPRKNPCSDTSENCSQTPGQERKSTSCKLLSSIRSTRTSVRLSVHRESRTVASRFPLRQRKGVDPSKGAPQLYQRKDNSREVSQQETKEQYNYFLLQPLGRTFVLNLCRVICLVPGLPVTHGMGIQCRYIRNG